MGLDAGRLARLYLCTDARERQGDLGGLPHRGLCGWCGHRPDPAERDEAQSRACRLGGGATCSGPYQAVVCVNDSAELAGRFSADMLHLGQRDGEASVARRPLHRWALIGRSTHSTEQADQAIADADVDYFCVGPIFATPTKPDDAPAGLSLVRYAADRAPVPTMDAKPWLAASTRATLTT